MRRPKNPVLVHVAKLFCRKLRRRQTAAETVLWEELRNRRSHDLKFLRQHPFFVKVLGAKPFSWGIFIAMKAGSSSNWMEGFIAIATRKTGGGTKSWVRRVCGCCAWTMIW